MSYKLRPSQTEAVDKFLKMRRALLTNPCGTGKTLIGCKIAESLNIKTHIICKAGKVLDWKKELCHVGPIEDLEVFSFESYHKNKNKPRLMIIDESQHIGSWATRKGRAILSKARHVSHLLMISATHSINRPMDYYHAFKLLAGNEGTKEMFGLKFCGAFRIPGTMFWQYRGLTNEKIFNKILDKITIHTSNDREIKLEKKIVWFNNIVCDEKIDFEDLAKKRQELGVEKFKLFKHYVRQHGVIERAVFFTRHRLVTEGLAKFFKCNYIIGGQSTKEKENILNKFNKEKKTKLVVSLESGGEGINILNCDTCYFLELMYSPKKHEQAILRLARSEENKVLKATYFVAKNEHAYAVNNKKLSYFNILELL